MLNITTEKDANQSDVHNVLVNCPCCGQKLTDVTYINGVAVLRTKCRRCRKFIVVKIMGSEMK